MSEHSAIEWTDATWNPVRGCTKISPGCKHCYAETFAERFRGVPGHPFEQGFDLRLVPEKLEVPLKWRTPKRIFVNSMSDLFHEDIPTEYIARVGRVMQDAYWHTYQILTKRHDRLRELLSTELNWMSRPPPRLVRRQRGGSRAWLPRIKSLQRTPARIRFLSIEPLLGDLGRIDLWKIDWVIVGGESGHGARPMKEAWVVSILEQCEAAGVPFFFKQWGGVRKNRAGRHLNGRTYNDIPTRLSG